MWLYYIWQCSYLNGTTKFSRGISVFVFNGNFTGIFLTWCSHYCSMVWCWPRAVPEGAPGHRAGVFLPGETGTESSTGWYPLWTQTQTGKQRTRAWMAAHSQRETWWWLLQQTAKGKFICGLKKWIGYLIAEWNNVFLKFGLLAWGRANAKGVSSPWKVSPVCYPWRKSGV